MLSRVDDKRAHDALYAGLYIRFVRDRLAQNRVEQRQRVTHAGKEKAVLIAEILIYNADRNAGLFGYNIDICPVQTALGKFVDARFEDELFCVVVKFFVHFPFSVGLCREWLLTR